MNLTDSKGQELTVGDKVVCSVSHVTAGGNNSTTSRDIKQGKVVGFNKSTVQVHHRDGTFSQAIKPRSILKVDSHQMRARSRKVLTSVGTNIVEATIINTTRKRYNVSWAGKHFQVAKHKAIKV